MFCFALTLLLACSAPYSKAHADDLNLVRGVHIDTLATIISAENAGDSVIWHTSSTTLAASLAAGRVLLHRYGCITCHDLDIPLPAQPQGPQLDLIAHKTSSHWLRRWLYQPSSYLPHSKMPHLGLSPRDIDQLTSFLLSQKPTQLLSVPPERATDSYRGAELYERMECAKCHDDNHTGPKLDRIGEKINQRWLYAFLKAPHLAQPGTSSHNFHLVDQDALDLRTFLIRRFSASPMADSPSPLAIDTTQVRAGIATAMRRSCFQCHRIESLSGASLPSPISSSRAESWLDAHSATRDQLPAISIHITDRQPMVAALTAAPEKIAETTNAPLPANFWTLPIPPQPASPFANSPALTPESCAQCHQQQAVEWSNSRHAQALSPGLLSQLIGSDDSLMRHCLTCHAPRQEQWENLRSTTTPIPGHGITCTACHVRNHVYYGPPADSLHPASSQLDEKHHGGAILSPALNHSTFCIACHQFDETGLSLNGKPLQNTHGEWAVSPQRAKGQSCQTCHMPEGRHTWPGIRSPELVGEALEMNLVLKDAPTGHVHASIHLHNRGAAHHIPTYSTPALFVKVFLADEHGSVIENSLQTRLVQRRLDLQNGRELFDTRIPAGGTWVFNYTSPPTVSARALHVVVEVDPDQFYRGFFEGFSSASPRARQLSRQAHSRLLDSTYILFARSILLAQGKP